MVFASSIFLFWFLPIFMGVYALTPRRWKGLTIALGSYVFYGWWRPDFVILMLISTLVDFSAGHGIGQDRRRGLDGRRWVWLSAVVNLGLLGYFKYANFGVDTLNAMMAPFIAHPLRWPAIVLPVGISFYTFQTLSYTVDVYRGTAKPVNSFTNFMCYVAMFPQLVAGPIVRYHTIAGQLENRSHTWGKISRGILAFQTGLAKKVLIADILAQVADRAFAAGAPSAADAWVGILAYTFQIYFDFSGYSDMAIGLGLMMGFRFPINFNQPYRSISITDFWRRWHISLSTFLRDYLYIPLGGNRKGKLRTYVNLAITMLLGGLWHGAAWTFVAWGAYQGFWLIIERLGGKKSLWEWAPGGLKIALTFVVVVFGWVLFRAPDLSSALSYAAAMLGAVPSGVHSGALGVKSIHVLAGAAAVLVLWCARTTQELIEIPSPSYAFVTQFLFFLAIAQVHFMDYVPFLYFRF